MSSSSTGGGGVMCQSSSSNKKTTRLLRRRPYTSFAVLLVCTVIGYDVPIALPFAVGINNNNVGTNLFSQKPTTSSSSSSTGGVGFVVSSQQQQPQNIITSSSPQPYNDEGGVAQQQQQEQEQEQQEQEQQQQQQNNSTTASATAGTFSSPANGGMGATTGEEEGDNNSFSSVWKTQPPKGKSSSIRQFLTKLSVPSNRKKRINVADGRLGGKFDASLPSRLLFRYISPLFDIAKQRRLEISDAFEVPIEERMDHSVDNLTRIYGQLRTKSRKQIEQKRLEGDEQFKQSQSLLLAKALFLSQRRLLLWTGILRLANTSIQAFPAILVAKLLRLVEAGNTQPTYKAVLVTMALVSVLMCKMITENQFFYYIVNYSTQIRGSLSGMIFDKSLRLPGGGSSVTRKGSSSKMNKSGERQEEAPLGTGGVLNLMQSDASIIESAALQLHTIWDGPLQIMIYSTLLFRYLGPSVLWGIAVLLTMIPVNSVFLRILNRLSNYENQAKDARTKRTSESITHMKLLKLQGWEQRFANDIAKHRREELDRHVTRGFVRAINVAISNSVPALVLVVTLTAYVKTGRPIVASTIFTAISLFNQLRFPLFFYPMLLDALANGKNALRRLSTYLSAEEIIPYVQTLPTIEMKKENSSGNGSSAAGSGGCIEMTNGNFLWTSSRTGTDDSSSSTTAATGGGASSLVQSGASSPALSNVNVKVDPGEVVAVIGPVGSGKSALIKGLLGELVPVPRTVVEQSISPHINDNKTPNDATTTSNNDVIDHPSVITYGTVSYCSQEAWLPKGTIQEAVTFGRPYDEVKYLAAIRDAGLDQDMMLSVENNNKNNNSSSSNNNNISMRTEKTKTAALTEVLSHDTDVGEGGSSLSGGQRARVAIARALYCNEDTKVFLLDDCLAALDASVGSTVFERLTDRLRKSNAATVMVTNDPSLPRRCDRVILMGKITGTCSSIVDMGTYDELIERGHELQTFSLDTEEGDDDDGEDGTEQKNDSTVKKWGRRTTTSQDDWNEEIEMFTEHHDASYGSDSGRPPKLHVRQKKIDTIRVVGSYEIPANSTDPGCHADPDCEIGMEKCPDYIADHVLPVSPDTKVDEDRIFSSKTVGRMNSPIGNSEEEERRSTTPPPPPPPATETVRNAAVSAEETTVAEKVEEVTETKQTTASSIRKQLVSADDAMSVGAVPRSAYMTYLKAVGNPLLLVGMVSTFLLANGAQFFQQFIVAKWTEVGIESGVALGSQYLRSLAQAALAVSVFLFCRSVFTMRVGVQASEFMHRHMLQSVFSAPMSFFDATPSGQLLSRFGKETETIDRALPDSIASVLYCFLQMFMAAISLAGVVTPALTVPLLLVGNLYYRTMSRFRPAARDMKRVETKTRSPIYTHFGEALRGTEIIRSIPGATDTWSSTHRKFTDINLAAFYTVKSFDRWLACRLESLGNIIILAAAGSSVLLTRMGRLKAGSAAWGLTQSLAITGLLAWAVRCLTDLETHMMSVVRVSELTDLDREEVQMDGGVSVTETKGMMPREKQQAGEALRPLLSNSGGWINSTRSTLTPINDKALAEWPWEGNVVFNNVSMRYNALSPLVLRGVTLQVPSGSTLGVVGRTGSGKSSLLLTLFRLVEIETSGSIEIDGVDIRSITLQTLRESLAIIPQDPVLFAGTLAYNLDATGKSSADDMWAALEASSPSLVTKFRSSNGGLGLETQLSEGGKNLSLGERQLLCLARALLRKSKVLVLDEATSSVDSKTDQEVQDTIRREFVEKGATVITVAHRLETVLGYDRIAVLGNGEVLEYGRPNDLLQIPDGALSQLVEADRQNKRRGAMKPSSALISA